MLSFTCSRNTDTERRSKVKQVKELHEQTLRTFRLAVWAYQAGNLEAAAKLQNEFQELNAQTARAFDALLEEERSKN